MKLLKNTLWILFISLALFLRINNLGRISFSYDQARDAFFAQDIINGDYKVVGPPTDIPQVFHGPLYYYVLAPLYAITSDPRFVVIFFTILNIISGLLLSKYLLIVTKNQKVPLLFFFFFAISPELVFYSRFISNISLVIPGLALAMFSSAFLSKKMSFIGLAIGLGMAAQAEFFLLSLFFVVIAYLLFRKEKISNIFTFLLTYLITISPYAISELKFKFRGLSSFFGFLGQTESQLGKIPERILEGYTRLFARNLFSAHNLIIGLLLILIIYLLIKKHQKKQKLNLSFIFLLFFSPLLLMLFVDPSPIFFTISALIPLLMLVSIVLVDYPLLIPLALIFSLINVLPIHRQGIENNGDYTGSEIGQLLSDEMKVVDIVSSLGKDTSYDSITAPMFTNTVWSYLFDWYGKSKYGFIPTWHGTSQTGMPGDKTITTASGKEHNSALIVDTKRVSNNWQDEFIAKESYYADLVKTETVGIYQVLIGIRKE